MSGAWNTSHAPLKSWNIHSSIIITSGQISKKNNYCESTFVRGNQFSWKKWKKWIVRRFLNSWIWQLYHTHNGKFSFLWEPNLVVYKPMKSTKTDTPQTIIFSQYYENQYHQTTDWHNSWEMQYRNSYSILYKQSVIFICHLRTSDVTRR